MPISVPVTGPTWKERGAELPPVRIGVSRVIGGSLRHGPILAGPAPAGVTFRKYLRIFLARRATPRQVLNPILPLAS